MLVAQPGGTRISAQGFRELILECWELGAPGAFSKDILSSTQVHGELNLGVPGAQPGGARSSTWGCRVLYLGHWELDRGVLPA